MAQRKTYKAINFDLETTALSAHFSSPTQAYAKLRADFKRQGFEHRQGSGYLSTKKLDDYQLNAKISIIAQRNPWLATCATQFDVTNVGKAHSLLGLLKVPQTPLQAATAQSKSKIARKTPKTSKKGGSGEDHGR